MWLFVYPAPYCYCLCIILFLYIVDIRVVDKGQLCTSALTYLLS